jgi:hypothetical protein
MKTICRGVIVVLLGLVASSARSDDGVVLKYKMAKGDKLIFRAKSDMKQNQTILGMQHENEMQSETIQSFTVEGIDDKGNYLISIKGERIKAKAKFAQLGEFSFDSQSSERDKSSTLGASLTPLFERLSGSTYQAVVTPDGEVIEVKGYADLIRDLVEDNPLTAQFSGGGTDDAAKDNLRGVFPKLPKSAAKVGDTWEASHQVAMGKVGVTNGKSVFRYVGPDKVADKTTAKLDVTDEAAFTLDIDMDGVKVTGTLNTTNANGTIQFNPEAGRVQSSQSTVTISGMLNVNANGMDIPVQSEHTVSNSLEYLEKIPN